jgi:hypothetical protein
MARSLLLTAASAVLLAQLASSINVVEINNAARLVMDEGVNIVYGMGDFAIYRSGIGGMAWEHKGNLNVPEGGYQASPANMFLAIGDTTHVVDPGYFADFIRYDSTVNTQVDANSFTSLMSVNSDGLDYSLLLTVTYKAPHNYALFKMDVSVPNGNTKPIILYTNMPGNGGYIDDNGAGIIPVYYDEPLQVIGSLNTNANPAPDGHFATIAGHVAGLPWTGYQYGSWFCGTYPTACELGENPTNAGPYTRTELTDTFFDPVNQRGANIMFSLNLGVASGGTYSTTFGLAMVLEDELADVMQQMLAGDSDPIVPAVPVPAAEIVALWIGEWAQQFAARVSNALSCG